MFDQVHPSGRVIHKGVNPDIDSYSAFFDNAKLGKTNLEELIRKEVCRKVDKVDKLEIFFNLTFPTRVAQTPMSVVSPPTCVLVGHINKL